MAPQDFAENFPKEWRRTAPSSNEQGSGRPRRPLEPATLGKVVSTPDLQTKKTLVNSTTGFSSSYLRETVQHVRVSN